MSVTNIAQGGNRVVQVLGLKEVQAKVREIADAFVKEEAARIMGQAAEIVVDQARSNAQAANIPHEAMDDFYVYERQFDVDRRLPRDSVTALAGLRKHGRKGARAYVKWFASTQASAGRDKTNRGKRRRDRFKLTMKGTQIGENLATMWEFGTSKMPARPFFRPAIQQVRSTVLTAIANGYRGILDRHSA